MRLIFWAGKNVASYLAFFLMSLLALFLNFDYANRKKTSKQWLKNLLFSILVQLTDLTQSQVTYQQTWLSLNTLKRWMDVHNVNNKQEKILLRRHLMILSIPDFNFVHENSFFSCWSELSWSQLFPWFLVSSSFLHRVCLFSFKRKVTKYNLIFLFFSCFLYICPKFSFLLYQRHRNYTVVCVV